MTPGTDAPNVVLITGTSSGIGLHTAIAAALPGHTVVAAMRNLDPAALLLALRRQTIARAVPVTTIPPLAGISTMRMLGRPTWRP